MNKHIEREWTSRTISINIRGTYHLKDSIVKVRKIEQENFLIIKLNFFHIVLPSIIVSSKLHQLLLHLLFKKENCLYHRLANTKSHLLFLIFKQSAVKLSINFSFPNSWEVEMVLFIVIEAKQKEFQILNTS